LSYITSSEADGTFVVALIRIYRDNAISQFTVSDSTSKKQVLVLSKPRIIFLIAFFSDPFAEIDKTLCDFASVLKFANSPASLTHI